MSSYILSAGRNVKGEEEGTFKNKKTESKSVTIPFRWL